MARITQGAFSLLPDLTNEQIKRQVEYAINNGFSVAIEYFFLINFRILESFSFFF